MLAGTAIIVLLVAAPPSPDAIGQAQRAVLSDPSYQTSWPDQSPPRRDDPGPGQATRADERWRPMEERGDTGPEADPGAGEGRGDTGPEADPGAGEGRFRRNRTPQRERSSTGDSGQVVLQSLLWVMATGILLLLAVSLIRAWRRAPVDIGPKRTAPTPPRAPLAALARPLTEAERLAADGRYADAAHVLLLETMAALDAHAAGGLSHSLTSREVLQSELVLDRARDAMSGLVQTVERSLFGNRPVDRVEYDRCSAAFSAFRAAYEGTAS